VNDGRRVFAGGVKSYSAPSLRKSSASQSTKGPRPEQIIPLDEDFKDF
jgi:hypothetical protein